MKNRKLKFRIWDKENKNMWSPQTLADIVDNTDMGQPIYVADDWESGGRSIGRDKSLVWMQYTGLEDKNGKEIYEGDIILTDQVVEWVDDSNVRADQEKGCYGIQNGKYNLGSYSDREDYEVIGNIYENSNLLEETKK